MLFQRKYFANQLAQAQVDYQLCPQTTLHAGLIRVPFGIFDWQETYRSGLIDYPMPRVDYGSVGVDLGVRGLGMTHSAGRVQAEGALFSGPAVSVWNDTIMVRGGAGRVQLFLPPTGIIGLSRWSGRLREDYGTYAVGLNGFDFRYGRPFLVVRGEGIWGKVAGQRYRGAYVDNFYRLPGLQAWTATLRQEWLEPSPLYRGAHQTTVGMRWTVTPESTVTLNWRVNNTRGKYPGTWVPQSGKRGDLQLQLYQRVVIR